MKVYYFTESNSYKSSDYEEEDIKYLRSIRDGENQLITNGDTFKVLFVGEVVCPKSIFFSFPKNVEYGDVGVDLIRSSLKKYKVDREGHELVFTDSGNFSSEIIFFQNLKKYFLDYITYEFIYPQKLEKVHSSVPVGGKIDVLSTIRNRSRYGTGVTYKTKNMINSDEWVIDDVYYYTLKELESKLNVSQSDIKSIDRMYKYLLDEGYNINKLVGSKVISNKTGDILVDLSNNEEVLSKIKKCDVGIIHNPIKNVLIKYYEGKRAGLSNAKVEVFFVSKFEKVWELIIQDALETTNRSEFRKEFKESGVFDKVETRKLFIPSSKVDEYLIKYPLKKPSDSDTHWMEIRDGRYFACEKFRLLIPDIFVDIDDKRKFIGDAKYYKDPVNANYDKEFYIYNRAINNAYPMVIFAIPESGDVNSTKVPRNGYRVSDDLEIIIITVCVEDVINDAINGTDKVLKKSIMLIGKYTNRW